MEKVNKVDFFQGLQNNKTQTDMNTFVYYDSLMDKGYLVYYTFPEPSSLEIKVFKFDYQKMIQGEHIRFKSVYMLNDEYGYLVQKLRLVTTYNASNVRQAKQRIYTEYILQQL